MRSVRLALAALLLAGPALAAPPTELTDSGPLERVRARLIEQRARPLHLATGPEAVVTQRFLFLRDVGQRLPAAPWVGEDAYATAFNLAESAFREQQPDGKRALVVFTSFNEGGRSLFYLPLANDIRGLGQGDAARIFDDTPGSALDGMIWLGELEALEREGEHFLREAFIHEIAHRFCCYLALDEPSLSRTALLGRQAMHWSFFSDQGTSPMEGNDWVPQGEAVYRTGLDTLELRFSPLDLYLMGVLPAAGVAPVRLLADPSIIEPRLEPIDASTPPARRAGRPVTVVSYRAPELQLSQIVRANGPRQPAPSTTPVVWPVGVVLLTPGYEQPDLGRLQRLAGYLARLEADFAAATGGRMSLDLSLEGAGQRAPGDPCPGGVDTCDRTRSDRCAPLIPGSAAVCARSCQDNEGCAQGECCAGVAGGSVRACVPAALCRTAPVPVTDGGAPEDAAPHAAAQQLTEQAPSCSSAAGADGAILWLLSAGLLRRRRRRCSPAG